jgi:hypothetical protein
MLADFCLRLAAGMVCCLLLLDPARTARPGPGHKPLANPVYFRTHFLILLAFAVGALLWIVTGGTARRPFPTEILIGVAAVLAFAGSVSWSLERSPGGVTLVVLTALSLWAAVILREADVEPPPALAARLAGAFSSALLLGSALSVMLIGHNYLISPTMSLTPLYRLLAATAVALVVRIGVEACALLNWTARHELASLNGDVALWLPVRWLVGFVAPAVLVWMAYQTARIRSTQSATGILYVVVIFCFLGELTAQLLRPMGVTL